MKLKKKLAEQYCGELYETTDSETQFAIDSYVAGFEKARELALDELRATFGNQFDDLYLVDDIKNLGEEEVE